MGRGRRRSRGRRGGWGIPTGLRDKLDLSGEQEEVLREQAKLFRARVHSLDIPGDTRVRLAAVMRSESLDETILGDLFSAHDDALRTLRLEAVERLAAVHDALDPVQRESLATLLERGFGGSGPFRGRH